MTTEPQPQTDRITRWLLIAIGIYSGLLVTLLNVVILSSGKVNDRAIILMADGLVLFWIVIGGALTPVFRKRLVPRLAAIPMDWRLRFVLLCTAMAMLEEVITTAMSNLAPLLGTTPEEAHICFPEPERRNRGTEHAKSQFLASENNYILLTFTRNSLKMAVEIKNLDGRVLDRKELGTGDSK